MTAPRTLLVVDDDVPFRTRLVKAFADRGFDAAGVGSAAEAIAAAEADSPELALVDLRLGDDSGLEVVQALKRIDATTSIVVLADCDGNVSQASRLLGIHRRSLQRKLWKHPVPEIR